MGDMADFYLDGAADECDDYDKFRDGYYSHQEAYDRGFVNELGGEERGPKGWTTLFATPRNKTQSQGKIISCKNCNKSGLSWKQHPSGKWWLSENNGDWHTCK